MLVVKMLNLIIKKDSMKGSLKFKFQIGKSFFCIRISTNWIKQKANMMIEYDS